MKKESAKSPDNDDAHDRCADPMEWPLSQHPDDTQREWVTIVTNWLGDTGRELT